MSTGQQLSHRITYTLLERDEGLEALRPPEAMWDPA